MNNKNKKIILSSLMLLGLLLLLVGVTFTALTYMNSSDANSINTGRISMSYSEPSNALTLENALPMSDTEGINQTNYFEFTVSSNASTNANDDIGITIPYEINISDIEIDNDKTLLPKDKIKVVLTKVTDGLEEKVMEPALINNLSISTLNTGSLKVYDTKNVHKNNNGSITTRYRLRAWIDKGFELDNTKVYQYKFRININSNTTPLSLLKVDKIMLEVWEDSSVAMSNNKDSVLRLANENGRWVEVLDEKTLTKDDRIRITFVYNNNIKGTAPVLSLKFGDNNATGTVSNGTIVDNKLSYEYTITKQDSGKLNINELVGGSIKDEVDNTPAVLTKQEKESLSVNAETVIVPLRLESIKTEVYKNNTWEAVATNTTVSKDDKVKITFNYNKEISGNVPTLTLNVGGVASKGTISTGVLSAKSLEYQYTVNKEDNGKIVINNLSGGSIKDEDEQGLPALTDTNKNAIPLNAETVLTFGETLIERDSVTTGDGLYSTTDTNSGKPSYYYKGNVTNNYVKLSEKDGNALYRIVRINEDGSVRLIRDQGINSNATYQFNPSSNNYSYMYYSNSNVTNGIMKRVNDWYAGAIEGTALDEKIVKASFCEQAKVKYSSGYTSGNAKMEIASKDYKASLKCEEDGNGKGPLQMKVGLITEDEVMLAGIPLAYNGITSAEYNKNTYLDMGSGTWYFWTMSPAGFYSSARARYVYSVGYASDVSVGSNRRVRPVFSLSADVLMTGKGTSTEPYELSMN